MPSNILVVEDSRTTRKFLTVVLKGDGYHVITAENGIEALERLSSINVDAIVTDLNMPQMDGLEFIRAIRENDDYSRIPILLLTTEGEERGRKQGLEAGATAYMAKPIEPEVFLGAVKKLITVIGQ
ncbi:MAG: response regulator [Nitrospinae bacterium]|nr:response regulator [Nitrospinota bacterium]